MISYRQAAALACFAVAVIACVIGAASVDNTVKIIACAIGAVFGWICIAVDERLP